MSEGLAALHPGIAITRIQPPRQQPAWVARPRLLPALEQAVLRQPLTLLCAAAGYGKTAALAQLVARLPAGTALAWIGADDDEQLPGFLACLAAACAPLALRWRVAPEALATLALADRGLREVAGVVADALAGAGCARGLLVLDDAHRIVDARVFELLQGLLERLPAHWGLVLSGRTEPPWPLARWRSAGRLAEFRQAELEFDQAEAQALLQAAGADAAAGGEASARAEAEALMRRTQGWAAGLRLCLSVERSAGRTGGRPGGPAAGRQSQRHLFDFLATEVLAGMPPRLREFLLQCSVLPELSAGRCERLTGMADAAELLHEVERRGLFVTRLAGDEPTLRLHDLFREFLEDRLRRQQPEAWRALLQRAAEGEPDLVRAVSGLQRAGAWEAALGLLLERGLGLLASGGASTLAQMLAPFPAEVAAAAPDLWMLRGLCAWPGYDFDGLRRCMHEAVAAYAAAGRERDAALASAHLCAGLQHMGRFDEGTRILARLGRLALDDAAMAFIHYGGACDAVVCGRPAEVAPRLAAMLAALQRVPDPAVWLSCPLQAMLIGAPGTAVQMTRYATVILQVAGDRPSPLRAGARHALAWQAVLDARLADARTELARADDDLQWLGRPRLLLTDNGMLHGLVQALYGDAPAARAAAAGLVDDVRRGASASFRRVHEPAMLYLQARVAWLLQDRPLLQATAEALQAARHGHEWPSGRGAHGFVTALLALADDRLDAALAAFEALPPAFDAYLLCSAVQARTLHAWALLRTGRLDEAAACLRPLLDAALAGEAEPGAVLLAGAAALQALTEAPWGGRLPEAGLAWLAHRRAPLAAPVQSAGPPSARLAPTGPPGLPGLVEGLTPREAEVLALLAAGQANKQIAAELGLSVHTVKQHVASVLGKLGVSSRGQAAARWHARAP